MFDMKFVSNPLAWVWVVARVLIKCLGKAKYQVLVIEIGTDYPGELQQFAFLKPHIGVLTAIAPEHMERFKTIQAVAKEEMSIADFCSKLVFNAGTVPKEFVPEDLHDRIAWYGAGTDYRAENYRLESGVSGVPGRARAGFMALDKSLGDLELQVLGEHSLGALLAAMVVGLQCDLDRTELVAGLQAVQPVKGRMQRLAGIADSVIIDDSYNASPDAVKAALDVLGQFTAPQRIAVLGAMNEMGDYSPEAHRQVGEYCDPAKVDMVVTIGADANKYLAEAAEPHGCKVVRFESPYDAGEYVKAHLQPGAVVLFKGSQNGVFAEEAIKPVLANKADADHLVRQSEYWMARKRAQFGDHSDK